MYISERITNKLSKGNKLTTYLKLFYFAGVSVYCMRCLFKNNQVNTCSQCFIKFVVVIIIIIIAIFIPSVLSGKETLIFAVVRTDVCTHIKYCLALNEVFKQEKQYIEMFVKNSL